MAQASSTITSYLPLTTTFTPPPDCLSNTWQLVDPPENLHWFRAGDAAPSACFPYSYRFPPYSTVVYSPGVCPSGWGVSCTTDLAVTRDGKVVDGALRAAMCCPSGYVCHAADPARHWEREFSCASPFSVDRSKWGISSSDSAVPSLYFNHILIVLETSTTSTLLTSTTPIPGPGSTPSTPSTPTSTPPPPPSSPSSTSLSAGAKAGISIGALLGVLSILLLTYFLYRHRKSRAREALAASGALPGPGDDKGRYGPVGANSGVGEYYGANTGYGGDAMVVPATQELSAERERVELDSAAAAGKLGQGQGRRVFELDSRVVREDDVSGTNGDSEARRGSGVRGQGNAA